MTIGTSILAVSLTGLVGKHSFGSARQRRTLHGRAVELHPQSLVVSVDKALAINFGLRANIQDDGVWFLEEGQDFVGWRNINGTKEAGCGMPLWWPRWDESSGGSCKKHDGDQGDDVVHDERMESPSLMMNRSGERGELV